MGVGGGGVNWGWKTKVVHETRAFGDRAVPASKKASKNVAYITVRVRVPDALSYCRLIQGL